MRQRGERLFTYATVKEYMFDGYSVQHYLNFLKSPAVTLVGGVRIPRSIETGRFGFYLGKNNTDDGEYVIRSGKNNPQEFGQIVSWNGKTKLNYYSGFCNLINGTDGSLAPPFLTKDSLIRFFSSDICRSIFVMFREEVNVGGIQAFRFKMPDAKTIFAHKDFCFCPKGKNNECFKYGVLSMAPCRDDAPIALSGAHFLDAYDKYQEMVLGLKPDRDKHETVLDIEPKTGVILRAAKRVQFNVMVHPNRDMTTFANVRATLFPFMWVEEMVEPNEVLMDELQQQLFVPVEWANQASVGGMAVLACLMLLGLLGMIWVNTNNRNKASSIHSDHSDSFHAHSPSRHTMRSTSPSLISSLSMGNSSHISSISQHHHGSAGPKSLPLSIVSVMSRGTMTSTNQGTMTDIPFNLEEDINRISKEQAKSKRVPATINKMDIVNTADVCVHEQPENEAKQGAVNGAFEEDTPSSGEGSNVAAAASRCSEYVNTTCSGRRRKFEPKYATIST
ncbi:Platelet glycoprotein 4 [Orchesella cincta]|uniref:Platelet glycoprotein 4 n=1 Tax=Orchesella cincta TaxID=48709 RepID=A0A1D2MH24_ORCCI|nr:Platelet glycoprotein 4 [Orchesella cincta]